MEYVYFLGNLDADDTAIKIGITYDIARRIHQLQGPVPFRLGCIEYIECPGDYPSAKLLEKTLHRILNHKRIKLEWFDIRRKDILPAVSLAFQELGLGAVIVEDTNGAIPPRGRHPYQTEMRQKAPV